MLKIFEIGCRDNIHQFTVRSFNSITIRSTGACANIVYYLSHSFIVHFLFLAYTTIFLVCTSMYQTYHIKLSVLWIDCIILLVSRLRLISPTFTSFVTHDKYIIFESNIRNIFMSSNNVVLSFLIIILVSFIYRILLNMQFYFEIKAYIVK